MPNPSEAWLFYCHEHHRDPWALSTTASHNPAALRSLRAEPVATAAHNATRDLQRRLEIANAYFRRKATEVLTDDTALGMMAVLYQDGLIDIAKLNEGQLAIALAKITAAGFCEIGVHAICITQSGERFVGSLIP